MDYNFTSSKRIMAQLLRRTKKCCVKVNFMKRQMEEKWFVGRLDVWIGHGSIWTDFEYSFSFFRSHFQLLQKLSFADASSTTSSPCHEPSQKCCHRNMYVPQINRTPTRHRVAPSPEHRPAANAFRLAKSSNHQNTNANNNNNNQVAHIFDDFHHSNQSLHSQTGHLSKLFRIRKSASSTKRAAPPPTTTKQTPTATTPASSPPKNTNRMNNAKHLMGAVATNQNGQQQRPKKRFNQSAIERTPTTTALPGDDEEIIFTENRIYAAATAASPNAANESPVNHNENTSTPSKQHTKHSFRAMTTIECFSKASTDMHANSVNRSSSTGAVPATATNSKSFTKEIVFEKVKLNHGERTAVSANSPQSARYPIQCIPFGCHSNSGSPINHHYSDSEYDNLNETFYHSEHSARSPKAMQPQYDDDTWDFLAGSRTDEYHNVVLTPSHPPLSNRRLYEIHYEAAVSSRRSSISTAETWIDDETFDNSFNEELEKRCATYC